MTYPAYEQYKDSGIPWLGQVPEGWNIKRIKMLTPVMRGASPRPIDDPQYFDDEGEYAWVRIADVSASDRYLENTTQRLSELGSSLSVKTQPGELFLSIAGTVGKPIITHIKCCIHDGFVYFPKLNINPEYLFYIFSTGQPYLGLGKMGTQLNLNTETVGNISIAVPSDEDINKIVDFLDRKVAEIDALIGKKEALLALLEEKRTATITHAVTKGLNPAAPLKPSGIPWLGDIPEHWDLTGIKNSLIQPITDGPHETPEILTEGIPFVSAEAIKNDKIDFNRIRGFISKEDHARFSKKYIPQRGDVYMVKSGATTGNVARVETDEEFNIWSPLAAMRPDPQKMTTDYLFYFIKSKPFFTSVELSWSMGTQQNIGMGVISNIRIAVPPIDEQKAITKYLEDNLSKMDAAKDKITAAIERLREYRTALITHAVTGKIKVV